MSVKRKGNRQDNGAQKGGEGDLSTTDKTGQGVLETLLCFRVHGKEDIINQYDDERVLFRDRNERLKHENDYLTSKKSVCYKALVEQAKLMNDAGNKYPSVEKEDVEHAKTKKMELAKKIKLELTSIREQTTRTDVLLEQNKAELKKWLYFKDITQHENASYIAAMSQTVKQLDQDVENTKSEFSDTLTEARMALQHRAAMLHEKEQMSATEQVVNNMDRTSRSEFSDNAWLKLQITDVKEEVEEQSAEVNMLEQRNLEIIEEVTSSQMLGMEKTRQIYLASIGRSPSRHGGTLMKVISDESLPSMVDVAKCTAEQMPGGQAGMLEMKMLCLRGHKAPFSIHPETLHLPPLHQQRHSHSSLSARTNWPVTNKMLKNQAL